MHIIWQIAEGYKRENVQRDFLKYTAQKIKQDLLLTNKDMLEAFRVTAKDRMYQIWERNPLSIDIYSEKVLLQKLHYIHNNPLQERWQLSRMAKAYKYKILFCILKLSHAWRTKKAAHF